MNASSQARTRLLVTGGRGQLGTDLVAAAARAGLTEVHTPGSAELDVTDPAAVRAAVQALMDAGGSPVVNAVVVNAAAYTAVDAAESDPERAHAVNSTGPAHLAAACAEHGARLVQVSTDYVFAGDAAAPYRVDDPTGPRSVYGRSKLAGERAVLGAGAHVVRTAWLYGAHGTNFVRTMTSLERSHRIVTVVDDQRGSPTWTADLADGLVALALAADRVPPGVLHCVNSGATTWCGLARAVFAEIGADPQRVRPCTSADFPRPAPRPANSVLDTASWAAAGLPPLRPWRAALASAFTAQRAALTAP
ncbi:MAG TPA: dTDP-4-dehydrorhamnose reductase [Pseudonocardiaceae bacterium]|nr:dTDP-4-dehydrorhamnose reductase [Pseudonocardiaceae bacterium]